MSLASAILFCAPGNVHREMGEAETGAAYRRFAIDEYDRLVSFDPGYNPLEPDARSVAGTKRDGRWLFETVFAGQPVRRVGSAEGPFASTSYLFNPEPLADAGALLPDLDVIEVSAVQGSSIDGVIHELKGFYERGGWRVEVYTGEIRRVPVKVPRFPRGIRLADQDALLEMAENRTGYRKEELCFRA